MPLLLADACAGNARQPFRAVVPGDDESLGIDEDHGVVHVVQQFGLEERYSLDDAPAAGAGRRVKSQ